MLWCVGASGQITPGADQTSRYFKGLQHKRVGLVVNQSSRIGSVLLPDTLLSKHFTIAKIFAPEHGFRGTAGAGEKFSDSIDPATHVKVVSLYGKHVKPSRQDLEGIDVMIFDIQDVGARFYTFLSTLQYVMLSCAENNIPLRVLDRPNPNGFYVDGPVLDTAFKSFVGLNPVPIVYGMTIGEYARMVNGEGWLGGHLRCKLTVVPVKNYSHNDRYVIPVKPSPNLPNAQSIALYPSLCLFEGTSISVARGTPFPFQAAGNPLLTGQPFAFTPDSCVNRTPPSLFAGKTCFGVDLRNYPIAAVKEVPHLHLSWLIDFYKAYPRKDAFFNAFFNKLAGNAVLQAQIKQGLTEEKIRKSWEPDLARFKIIRKKYLLYDDFAQPH